MRMEEAWEMGRGPECEEFMSPLRNGNLILEAAGLLEILSGKLRGSSEHFKRLILAERWRGNCM